MEYNLYFIASVETLQNELLDIVPYRMCWKFWKEMGFPGQSLSWRSSCYSCLFFSPPEVTKPDPPHRFACCKLLSAVGVTT